MPSRPVQQPYVIVDYIPQSEIKNVTSGSYLLDSGILAVSLAVSLSVFAEQFY